jgi:hypothetical protein
MLQGRLGGLVDVGAIARSEATQQQVAVAVLLRARKGMTLAQSGCPASKPTENIWSRSWRE